jgi:glycosyltransferase involved in cell wall biosynthesis
VFVKNSPNILFTATFSTPFIQHDLSTLQKHFTVTPIFSSGLGTIFQYLKVIHKYDIIFSWFGSVYSSLLVLFAAIFRKRSILVLGGVDVAKEKDLHYGIWDSWWKSIIVRYGITHADIVLAVDESLKQNAIHLCNYNGSNIVTVPTGYDPKEWVPSGIKEPFVLTVANIPDDTRVKIKGLDFLIQVAKQLPNIQFIVIGISPTIKESIHYSDNVELIEFVEQKKLLLYYQRAKIYFQPSYREGLPNTLCEAMLCECYPIGTNVGGIESAIGSTGTVIPYGDISAACKNISDSMVHGNGKSARERISQLFLHSSRESALVQHIESLLR